MTTWSIMPCACREQRSSSNRHLRPRAVTRRGRHGHQELTRGAIYYGRPAGATARWRHAPPRPPSGWTGPTRGTWRGAMSLVKALTTTLTKLRWDSGVGGDSSPCRASPTRQRRGLAWPCRDLVHGRTAGVCCRGLKPTPQAAAHAPATQHLPVRACRTIEALVAVRRVPGQHIE